MLSLAYDYWVIYDGLEGSYCSAVKLLTVVCSWAETGRPGILCGLITSMFLSPRLFRPVS